MSRATKAYASAYQPGRVHESSIVRGESRLFECDFNGALGGETITAAQWDNGSVATVALSGLSQADGVVSVSALGVDCGRSVMVCQVTTSGSRTLQQVFQVMVIEPMCSGATILTWTAA